MKISALRLVTLLIALVAGLSLAGCNPADKRAAQPTAAPTPQHTPGSHVDAEDYVGPVQPVVAKRFDPAVPAVTERKKVKGGCKARKNGKCTAYHPDEYKTVTTREADDADWVLILRDATEVDVDQATYDGYVLDDPDTAADVFPRG